MKLDGNTTAAMVDELSDFHLFPVLSKSSFRPTRQHEFKRKGNEATSIVKFAVSKDRKLDYRIVTLLISICYSGPARMLSECFRSKKVGELEATVTTSLDHLTKTEDWPRGGVGVQTDWGHLTPKSNTRVSGPILASQMRETGIPFLDSRSSLRAAIDLTGLGYLGDLFERKVLLRSSCYWILGRREESMAVLDAEHRRLEESVHGKHLPLAIPILERVVAFRKYLGSLK